MLDKKNTDWMFETTETCVIYHRIISYVWETNSLFFMWIDLFNKVVFIHSPRKMGCCTPAFTLPPTMGFRRRLLTATCQHPHLLLWPNIMTTLHVASHNLQRSISEN